MLGVLGLLALIVGGVLFLPFRQLKSHRRLAKWLAIGGALSFAVGLALTPTPPKGDATASQVVGSDAAQKASEAKQLAAEAKQERADQAAAQRQHVLENYRETLRIAKGCDEAMEPVGRAANKNDVVALYSAAKAGQEACEAAWMDLNKIEAMSGAKEEKAVETCHQAYFLRQRAMETAMTIADGDAKPSNIVSFQDDVKAGQAGVMLCVAQWMDAGSAVGIKLEEMK